MGTAQPASSGSLMTGHMVNHISRSSEPSMSPIVVNSTTGGSFSSMSVFTGSEHFGLLFFFAQNFTGILVIKSSDETAYLSNYYAAFRLPST
jgi:hypothetical protein